MIRALLLLLAAVTLSLEAAEAPRPKWQIAKELLDDQFVDASAIQSAAKLLVAAQSETPQDPNVYVQAARLTIKGGEAPITSLFRPGTVEAYAELLDRALKLDPSHKKGLILRAEAYSIVGDLARERSTLALADKAPGVDRWLQIGWARYANTLKDSSAAYHFYDAVQKLGPGDALDQRNAYVFALGELAAFRPPPGEPFRLKELAELAKRHRSPKDYQSPSRFAGHFIYHGFYMEAIECARDSLRIRQTTGASLTLASALFGAAALRTTEGAKEEASRLAKEARSFGFTKDQILQRLAGPSGSFSRALPNLESLIGQ